MAIIQYHEGCSTSALEMGCMGSYEPYYTIFGSKLRFLTGHFFVSFIIGFAILTVLFKLRKNNKIKLSDVWLVIISVVSTTIIFFLLAYLFPVVVSY